MVNILDAKAKQEISEAITKAEELTSGEIRVHLKRFCKGDALSEAQAVFEKLGMHRTRERNGVLIYIALQSRQFAIAGDSGIHERVGSDFWSVSRDIMESYFSKGLLKEGIIEAVVKVGDKLKVFFPANGKNPDELSNTVTED